ncbi:L-amino acid amidase [Cytospora mali]|uniref:L-amino acid amidase n=1 Tax=Cytospora mali TaxID=578113 RepID=A0A194UUQ2_CYTMA|nr:L-amino acid amidase [Valsa mali var. pyri (nom. inval.)]
MTIINITDPAIRQPPPGQVRTYPPPTSTGKIPFTIPSHNLPSETWYAIYGTLTPTATPLIALHGGPGCGHNYLKPLSLLSTGPHARPVILYDQIGCGHSTRFRDRRLDDTFWRPGLFTAELDNLVSRLGIKRFDVLGHSWGGMLAAEYAVTRPVGLRRLVICDSLADMATFITVEHELRGLLPSDVQETLWRGEEEGNTGRSEYEAAIMEFYKLFLCRVRPISEEFIETLENMKEDDTAYYTMNGSSVFQITGSLKDWDIRPKLHKIEVPTLLINGKFDNAQDAAMAPFFSRIQSKVKWVKFAESSHLPHLEETEDFMIIVSNFLTEEI